MTTDGVVLHCCTVNKPGICPEGGCTLLVLSPGVTTGVTAALVSSVRTAALLLQGQHADPLTTSQLMLASLSNTANTTILLLGQ